MNPFENINIESYTSFFKDNLIYFSNFNVPFNENESFILENIGIPKTIIFNHDTNAFPSINPQNRFIIAFNNDFKDGTDSIYMDLSNKNEIYLDNSLMNTNLHAFILSCFLYWRVDEIFNNEILILKSKVDKAKIFLEIDNLIFQAKEELKKLDIEAVERGSFWDWFFDSSCDEYDPYSLKTLF
jgi:hypothetical protein